MILPVRTCAGLETAEAGGVESVAERSDEEEVEEMNMLCGLLRLVKLSPDRIRSGFGLLSNIGVVADLAGFGSEMGSLVGEVCLDDLVGEVSLASNAEAFWAILGLRGADPRRSGPAGLRYIPEADSGSASSSLESGSSGVADIAGETGLFPCIFWRGDHWASLILLEGFGALIVGKSGLEWPVVGIARAAPIG